MTRQRNGSSHRWRRLRARVLSEENDCGLCGQPVDKTVPTPLPGSPEVDHKVPYSKGGDEFARDNVWLTHRACNRAKSNSDGLPYEPPRPLSTSRKW